MAASNFTTAPQGEGKRDSGGRAKLTPHEVDLIRELIEDGLTLRQIAARFAPKG